MKFLKIKDLENDTLYYYPMNNVISIERYHYDAGKHYRILVTLIDGTEINFSTKTSWMKIVDDIELNIGL